MKFNKWYLILPILLVVVLTPLIINGVANNYITDSPAEFSAWLGFWGSYTGGILSAIITLGGVYLGFRLDRKEKIRQAVFKNYSVMMDMTILIREISKDVEEKKVIRNGMTRKKESTMN